MIKSDTFSWQIRKHLNCQTKNIIDMIECNKDSCRAKYIGETQRTFSERIYDHIKHKTKKIEKPTGYHFNAKRTESFQYESLHD